MPSLWKILILLFQVGDYAVKAVVHFANTEEGEKEWGDVLAAFVDLDLFNPSDAEQGVTVERRQYDGSGINPDEADAILSQYEQEGVEQVERGSTATTQPRIVHRPQRTVAPSNTDDIPF